MTGSVPAMSAERFSLQLETEGCVALRLRASCCDHWQGRARLWHRGGALIAETALDTTDQNGVAEWRTGTVSMAMAGELIVEIENDSATEGMFTLETVVGATLDVEANRDVSLDGAGAHFCFEGSSGETLNVAAAANFMNMADVDDRVFPPALSEIWADPLFQFQTLSSEPFYVGDTVPFEASSGIYAFALIPMSGVAHGDYRVGVARVSTTSLTGPAPFTQSGQLSVIGDRHRFIVPLTAGSKVQFTATAQENQHGVYVRLFSLLNGQPGNELLDVRPWDFNGAPTYLTQSSGEYTVTQTGDHIVEVERFDLSTADARNPTDYAWTLAVVP